MRLYYQPILRLADRRMDHVEVLYRSFGADGELRGPEAMIDAMTGTGLALPLTLAIMRRALTEYRAYHFAATDLTLAFNLPLDAMLHPALGKEIATLCHATGVDPSHIRFELTETSPVEDFAAAAAGINRLHAAGHHVSLDDVSPDMPYLAALMALPVSAIKFSNTLVADPASLPFIRAMAAEAASYEMDSIAEGIETPAQLAAVREAGVTHGQGYLFSHPMPACALGNALNQAA
jgi:EAL domain-containing protein (putative c-di-GMP-specific phosphodiesterase class I)